MGMHNIVMFYLFTSIIIIIIVIIINIIIIITTWSIFGYYNKSNTFYHGFSPLIHTLIYRFTCLQALTHTYIHTHTHTHWQ